MPLLNPNVAEKIELRESLESAITSIKFAMRIIAQHGYTPKHVSDSYQIQDTVEEYVSLGYGDLESSLYLLVEAIEKLEE